VHRWAVSRGTPSASTSAPRPAASSDSVAGHTDEGDINEVGQKCLRCSREPRLNPVNRTKAPPTSGLPWSNLVDQGPGISHPRRGRDSAVRTGRQDTSEGKDAVPAYWRWLYPTIVLVVLVWFGVCVAAWGMPDALGYFLGGLLPLVVAGLLTGIAGGVAQGAPSRISRTGSRS
jgi:hypothetical protein